MLQYAYWICLKEFIVMKVIRNPFSLPLWLILQKRISIFLCKFHGVWFLVRIVTFCLTCAGFGGVSCVALGRDFVFPILEVVAFIIEQMMQRGIKLRFSWLIKELAAQPDQ
ncbi:hypothetical protein I3843_02G011700 [Carya illinoinensis]|nr:hypothetical protein I3843_02G011700 [Carya illinoinensis]